MCLCTVWHKTIASFWQVKGKSVTSLLSFCRCLSWAISPTCMFSFSGLICDGQDHFEIATQKIHWCQLLLQIEIKALDRYGHRLFLQGKSLTIKEQLVAAENATPEIRTRTGLTESVKTVEGSGVSIFSVGDRRLHLDQPGVKVCCSPPLLCSIVSDYIDSLDVKVYVHLLGFLTFDKIGHSGVKCQRMSLRNWFDKWCCMLHRPEIGYFRGSEHNQRYCLFHHGRGEVFCCIRTLQICGRSSLRTLRICMSIQLLHLSETDKMTHYLKCKLPHCCDDRDININSDWGKDIRIPLWMCRVVCTSRKPRILSEGLRWWHQEGKT